MNKGLRDTPRTPAATNSYREGYDAIFKKGQEVPATQATGDSSEGGQPQGPEADPEGQGGPRREAAAHHGVLPGPGETFRQRRRRYLQRLAIDRFWTGVANAR